MDERRYSQRTRSVARSSPSTFSYELGAILYLPLRHEIVEEDLAESGQNDRGFYGHPVVLFKINTTRTEATVLNMTSFKGVELQVKHPRNKSVRLKYLPISPSPPHPDHGVILEQEGEPLRYNSYVNIEKARVFSSRVLRPHGGRRLTTRSFKTLKSHAEDIPLENYVPAVERLLDYSEFNTAYTFGNWAPTIRDLHPSHQWNNTATTRSPSSPYTSHGHSQPAVYHTQRPGTTHQSSLLFVPPLASRIYQNNNQYGTFASPVRSSDQTDGSRPDEEPSSYQMIFGLVLLCAFAYGGYLGIKTLFGFVTQSVRGSGVGAAILRWIFG